jgi:hypothetical protein
VGRLKDWWRSKVVAALIADDPEPEPSWLDRMDDRREEPSGAGPVEADAQPAEFDRSLLHG